MARRKIYSNLRKVDQSRPKRVDGQTLYKVFQCLNPNCDNMIVVNCDDLDENFSIICPKCGYDLHAGGKQHLFNYSMEVDDSSGSTNVTEEGEFYILHDDYLKKAPLFKYCLLCYTLKPIDDFDFHKGMKSGRQGECRDCKKKYNAIKNGTRIPDQFFESSQKRRLLIDVSGDEGINRKKVEDKFNNKCFNCGRDLTGLPNEEKHIDHTLPVYYLWPASTDNATLLCHQCNEQKTGKWPSEFYSSQKLHDLAILTGYEYDLLAGKPIYNPLAIGRLKDSSYVDEMLQKNAEHMNEVCSLRNRILKDLDFDFFEYATAISNDWKEKANSMK